MDIFLRAKHWQLFLVTFGLPMVFQIIIMVNMFSSVFNNPNQAPTAILSNFVYFPVLMILCMTAVFGWIWSICVGLQKFVPSQLKLKVTKFKIFFFFPVIYIVFLMMFLSLVIFNGNLLSGQPSPLFLGSFLFIFPLHLFSMFCIFYCLYFAAKTLKTIELQRTVSISDYLGEFFLIWFFPIGVWILQPRINQLMADRAKAVSLD